MPPRYPVACPTCGAKPYHQCVTVTTHRPTDTHVARIEATYPPRNRTTTP